MSKVRIYELARELGVDNRVLINKASELGIPGRLSHSSSIDGDEADQIRRAFIRQAVGKQAKDTEVVTTRVDKSTGETEAIVERRKGNVIRRRKQASEDTPAEAAQEEPASADAGQQAEISSVAEEFRVSDEEAGHDAPVSREEHELAASTDVAEETSGEETESALTGSEQQAEDSGESSLEAEPEEDGKKAIGPKVLGRIALPQRKAAAAPSAERSKASTGPIKELAQREVDDSEERGKGGVKRKGKRREFSRVDLVDYESREPRRSAARTGKTGKSRGDRSDEGATQAAAASVDGTKPRLTKRPVKIGDVITVGELAREMNVKAGELISRLIELGIMATINQGIDKETATIVAEEMGFEVTSTSFDESQLLIDTSPDRPEDLVPRAPVVTVMGHVDHGKTSLLDRIRESSVAAKEHGGITQHIGAYSVPVKDKGRITFIDTPGHAAFTSMRARGAKITDIVILVVAADDGVMPQTIEALNHAKAAGVPIIVAVNKMDRPDANPDRVKQQLTEHGLQPEDWGGDTMYYPVSALKGTGISELLEGILLQAEVKELKGNPKRRAQGAIIEAKQEKGKGTVATVLVQTGTLRIGDVFVSGSESGRIRSMTDHAGCRVTEAGPSTPVEITGLTAVPLAGDDFIVVESEAKAREVALERSKRKQQSELRALGGPISLEEFAKRANNMAAAELNLILKTDVHGSLEAVRDALEQLSNAKVRVRVLHAAVGGVNESDVQLAIASNAIVVGFGVRAEARATTVAEEHGVQLRFYRIIYELLEDIKKAMVGLLAPVREEVRTGRVEVRETFSVPKTGTVAGCYVIDGAVKRGAFVRLLRDSRVIHEGKMASLRRFKDDVREVQSGFECGIVLDGFNDVKAGDQFEVYEFKETQATLD